MASYPDYRLVCTWGARGLDAQACAGALQRYLAVLATLAPDLGPWYSLDPKDRLTPLPDDAAAFRRQVLAPGNGGARGVAADVHLPEVGFNALLLTARSGGASLLAHLGQGAAGAHNRLALTFPRRGQVADALLQPAVVERLLLGAVEFWQPQWAWVDHTDIDDADPGMPPVYWMLYGDASRGELPALTHGVQSHLSAVGGWCVVTTPARRYDRSCLQDRQVSEAVKSSLKASGWL